MTEQKQCVACGESFSRPKWAVGKRWGAMKVCSLGCASAIGNKKLKGLRPTVAHRFYNKVDKSSGYGPHGDCWRWTGGLLDSGYGRLSFGRGEVKAHRYSYQLATGKNPGDMFVCHSCDNPSCVNPDHLFLGISQDNVDDMTAKGRHVFGKRHHKSKLNEDQVICIRADQRRQIDIAAEYGVTQGLIGMIKRREIWRHVG